MKKLSIILIVIVLSLNQFANAQCSWQTVLSDGFEYTTVCPDLIPGTTVHNVPQSFAVHTGSTSLYLNFVNCNGGTGTCAGAKVYERRFVVCPNVPVQLSTYLTTSFSGTQCNMHIMVAEKDGTVLNDQTSVSAPYSPSWYQYQSGSITPVTDTIVFTMYTNVDGGNGNDLSMDDFLLERCIGDTSSTNNANACNNLLMIDLFNSVPAGTLTSGVWSGPGVLGGGFLGSFLIGSGIPGTYVYQTTPYGTSATCPLVNDSVIVTVLAAPIVNLGPDVTLCLNQSLLLNAGSGPNYTYLWNNGVTGPSVFAFTTSTTNVSNNYSVTVTAGNGCTASDAITVNFVVCTGIEDKEGDAGINIYPNPASNDFTINWNFPETTQGTIMLYDAFGKCVKSVPFTKINNTIRIENLAAGIYEYRVLEDENCVKSGKLMVAH